MTDEKTVLLEKVTLNYIAVEDRIRMQSQIKEGDPVTFWLTQRLCRELIKALVKYFDTNTHTATRAGKSVLQAYHQEEAVQKKARTSSVDASTSPLPPVLVTTLNIRSNPESLVLRLPLPDGTVTAMPLKPVEARQLLQILYGQYRLAEWPMDMWPDWMVSQMTAVAAGEALH